MSVDAGRAPAGGGKPPATGGKFGSKLGLIVGISAAAIGVIYGYDTGVIAGALLFIPDEFHLSTAETSSVATAVAIGMIVGALVASRLADKIGRKLTMIGVAAGYVVFAALSGFANGIVWLDAARFLLGVTIGISVVTAPVFVAESAPTRIRGALVASYQVATVAGIAIAYLVDYGLAPAGAWRWMLAVSAFPAAAVGIMLLRLPDTPRWYMMRGRQAEARRVLAAIDPDVDVDAELASISEALRSEHGTGATGDRSTKRGVFREMVRRPYRKATLFVLGLGFLVQITGINAVIYYTPLIFSDLGIHGRTAQLLVPALVQAIALVATLFTLRVVDRVGRRRVLLTGIVTMIVASVLLMVVYAVGSGPALAPLAFAGILLFTVGYDFGFGALVWVYAAESFPARLRTAGASTMLTSDLVANLLIAQFFLSVIGVIGGTATFGLFLGLAVIAWGYVFFLAPETRGRPLEAIQEYWENGGRWPEKEKVDHQG